MTDRTKLKEILEQNPRAKEQASAIQEALDLVQSIRKLGKSPKKYDLGAPFGNRAWLTQCRVEE